MRSKLTLISLLLVAAMAAGCGSKPAETTTPPAATNPTTQNPTTPPATSPGTTPATTPAASSSGTKYAVVAESSTASYAVRETFLGQNLNVTAVGTTSAFTGEIILDEGVIKPSVVRVDLTTLKSDEARRDRQVQNALGTHTYKVAAFRITGAEGNPVLKDGQEATLKLQGEMTIKSTTKPLVFDAKVKLDGDTLTLVGETTFKMTDFDVTPPSIGGFVSVVDEVKLDINYVGKR